MKSTPITKAASPSCRAASGRSGAAAAEALRREGVDNGPTTLERPRQIERADEGADRRRPGPPRRICAAIAVAVKEKARWRRRKEATMERVRADPARRCAWRGTLAHVAARVGRFALEATTVPRRPTWQLTDEGRRPATFIPKCCDCSTAMCTARSTGAAFSTAPRSSLPEAAARQRCSPRSAPTSPPASGRGPSAPPRRHGPVPVAARLRQRPRRTRAAGQARLPGPRKRARPSGYPRDPREPRPQSAHPGCRALRSPTSSPSPDALFPSAVRTSRTSGPICSAASISRRRARTCLPRRVSCRA